MVSSDKTIEDRKGIGYGRRFEDWLAKVDEMGELRRVEGAHWNLEIGAVSALNEKGKSASTLLFDNIVDYPQGYRVLTCAANTRTRIELTFHLSKTSSAMELVQTVREKLPEWERRARNFRLKSFKMDRYWTTYNQARTLIC